MSKTKRSQELAREALLLKQAEHMLTIIEKYADTPIVLEQELKQEKIKPDAMEMVINYIKENNINIPKDSLKIVEDIYLTHTIIPPKARPVIKIGKKPGGLAAGRLVTKVAKNSDDLDQSKESKLQNTWMEKSGSNDGGGKGEEVCEYIGTNLVNQVMGKNSPKFRLYKDADGNVKLMSKFIPKFQTIYDREDNHLPPIDTTKAQGFASFFAANILAGDYDVHGGNVGFTTDENGNHHWARIDNGRALSYNTERDFTRGGYGYTNLATPQTVEGFKQTMLSVNSTSTTYYPESLFEGINFACELNTEADKVDINKYSTVIKLSMDNLKIAYGDDFLNIPEINKELKERMGFAASDILTEKVIEDKVIENITKLKAELKEMAKLEFGKALMNIPNAIDKNGIIDYKKVLTSLSPRPNDLSLFMESAIISEDFNGIQYLAEQSKSLMKIDNLSPLSYAIKENKNELVVKMMKAGFSLNKDELPKEQLAKIEQATAQIRIAIKTGNIKTGNIKNLETNLKAIEPSINISIALLDLGIANESINNNGTIDYAKLNSNLVAEKTENLSKLMKHSIKNNNLEEVISLTKLKPDITVPGTPPISPLKYALDEKRNKLSVKMVRAGLVLKEDETTKDSQSIKNSHGLIRKLFSSSFTENDKIRLAVLSSAEQGNNKQADLSKRPSPLNLAIQMGKIDLAAEMIKEGFVLKKSELGFFKGLVTSDKELKNLSAEAVEKVRAEIKKISLSLKAPSTKAATNTVQPVRRPQGRV